MDIGFVVGTETDSASRLYDAYHYLYHHGACLNTTRLAFKDRPNFSSFIVSQGFGFRTIVSHSPKAFVFLYCLANFFQNFGPNTTTFVIPGEAFPTRYRSTAHGISAASGKLGAIVAQVGFAQLKDFGGTNQVRFFLH